MSSENPTTALTKIVQSPTLARVSNQLSLTDKLLNKKEDPLLIPYRLNKYYAPDVGGWGREHFWTFRDENKNIILTEYYGVSAFVNGFAQVLDFEVDNNGLDIHSCYGFIDVQGKIIVKPDRYSDVKNFSEEYALVTKCLYGNGFPPINQVGFIDELGREVISTQYDEGRSFSEGLAAVGITHNNYEYGEPTITTWGAINKSGEVILPIKYSNIPTFKEGLAAIRIGYKSGYINKYGEDTIALQYVSAKAFSQGLAAVSLHSAKKNNGYGFINKNNDIVIPLVYDDCHSFSEGLAAAQKGENWGFINEQNQIVITFLYKEVYSFSENRALIMRDGKYGFINKIGDEIIPCIYEEAFSFSENRAAVKKYGKWGFINRQGQIVIEHKYSSVDPFLGGIAKVRIPDEFGYAYIGLNGEEYWEK